MVMEYVEIQESHYGQGGGNILVTDFRDLYNICIIEPRVYTYHQVILA